MFPAAKSLFGVLDLLMKSVKHQSARRILHNFSGALKAGEMLLIIGKSGSGCSTFVKTLANMKGEYKDITGDMTYGGNSAAEMEHKLPRHHFLW